MAARRETVSFLSLSWAPGHGSVFCGCVQSLDCPGGGTCTAGRCLITLASGQGSPYPLAVDATSVYWATQMVIGGNGTPNGPPGSVMKVSVSGGTPMVLAGGTNGPYGLAVDSTSVYWTDGFNGTVMKVPLAGGIANKLASGLSGAGHVVVDATSVYWTDYGAVQKVPLTGGAAVTLARAPGAGGETDGVAVDATSVYWTTRDPSSTMGPASISKLPLGGGVTTTLVSLAPGAAPIGIAVDTANVYWTGWTGDDYAVMKVPLAGGTPTNLASGQDNPTNIVVDATNVYWVNNARVGAVMKVPIGGGTHTVLFSGSGPWGIAVDETSVYWTNTIDGTVMRLSPK